MKYAHTYKLIVKWSKRPDWEINLLAVNAEVISMWLSAEETKGDDDYIITVIIQLMKRNAELVKDEFLAKNID